MELSVTRNPLDEMKYNADVALKMVARFMEDGKMHIITWKAFPCHSRE